MGSKLKFVGITLVLVAVAYLFLTATMGVVSTLAFTSANDTSMANFASTQAGLRWTPLFLYFVPGIIGIGAIAWRLTRKD